MRVREDAPRVYLKGWNAVVEYRVYAIDGEAAIITYGYQEIAIHTKCLIKVEGEVKEPKFKRGDKVVSKPPFVEKVWTVLGYDDKMPYMVKVGDGKYINERNLEPYTESAEDEIIRQREAEFDEFAKEELDRVHHPEKYATYEATIDNVAMDWTAYTADLAKEIALKVANKYNGPEQAAEYAVKVAKAVVEGLKMK